MSASKNFIRVYIRNDKIGEDKVNKPTEFEMTKDELRRRNIELKKMGAPGRFVKVKKQGGRNGQ